MRDGRRRRTNKQVMIELLSQWMLEAEFRNCWSETSPVPQLTSEVVVGWKT